MLDVTFYNLQVLTGIIFFLFALKKDPDVIRVDIDKVINFGIACFVIFIIKAYFYSANGIGISYLNQAYSSGINTLAAVWWEDACFVLPYLLLYRFIGKQAYLFFPVFVATSIVFMMGHAYQGPTGQVTFIFPFISFYYGKKYGAGTMMLCHILYDTIIVVCLGGLSHLIFGAS